MSLKEWYNRLKETNPNVARLEERVKQFIGGRPGVRGPRGWPPNAPPPHMGPPSHFDRGDWRAFPHSPPPPHIHSGQHDYPPQDRTQHDSWHERQSTTNDRVPTREWGPPPHWPPIFPPGPPPPTFGAYPPAGRQSGTPAQTGPRNNVSGSDYQSGPPSEMNESIEQGSERHQGLRKNKQTSGHIQPRRNSRRTGLTQRRRPK